MTDQTPSGDWGTRELLGRGSIQFDLSKFCFSWCALWSGALYVWKKNS